jgi:hypothetical protein
MSVNNDAVRGFALADAFPRLGASSSASGKTSVT